MNCSISRWITTIAAMAVLAVPAVTRAQTPPATTPQQPPAASAPADTQPASPAEHLRLAKTAIESIPAESLTSKSKTQVGAVKRHLSALERAAAAKDAKAGSAAGAAATAATAGAAKAGPSWATEVAAIDKILTELTGPASTSGAAPSAGAVGTAGASKAADAVALDDTARAKLMEVRTHVTAFAAAMSGTAPAPAPTAPTPMTPSPDAMAAANPPVTSSANPTATGSAQPPATAAAQPPPATGAEPATPSVAGATPQTPTPDASVDQEAAAKHLTAARDALTQLTQLPAAAQLTGDARTQVQQLIANFNELITTKAEWRASYAKVDANLTALIGAEGTDESPTTPPSSGTAGAVGTAGTTPSTLDPAVRAKLMEMRTHLAAFQKAAGGPGL